IQAGNSIGGAVSQDGQWVAAQNYQPGGIKVFRADTLALVADVPAEYAPGRFSRVVGLADLPGQRFIFSLFDADEIWIADLSRDAGHPAIQRFRDVGRQPYDALVTPDIT
ncbi:protein nirF, partial [Klebsiella pneumoniae]|nr:protein nirF [Klebsiella pneumoniae]